MIPLAWFYFLYLFLFILFWVLFFLFDEQLPALAHILPQIAPEDTGFMKMEQSVNYWANDPNNLLK